MSNVTGRHWKQYLGVILALLAGFLISLSAILYKLTKETTAVQVLVLRFFFVYLVSIPLLSLKWVHGELPSLDCKAIIVVLFYGFFGAGSSLLFFLSLNHLPAGDSIAITNSYFVVTLLFSWLVLKEKQHPCTWILALLCIIGMVLVAAPFSLFGKRHDSFIYPQRALGVVEAVISMFCTTGRFISGRILKGRAHAFQMTCSISLQALICFPVYSYLTNKGWYIPCESDWAYAITSALCAASTVALLAQAIQLERVGPVTMAFSTLIVFGFILEVLLLRIIPAITSVIGASLITFSSILTIYLQMRIQENESAQCRCNVFTTCPRTAN